MPCYNASNTLSYAIDSVLAQDYCEFELIIVDDRSSDSSCEIALSYTAKDNRIKLLQNKNTQGVSGARNTGIEVAAGRFICFLDSDDYLLPNSIANRISFLIDKNLHVVYGSYYRLLTDGSFVHNTAVSRISYADMLKRNYIGNLTGLYDVSAIGKIYQKNVGHEDYLMWIEISRKVPYIYSVSDSPIAVYRVSSNSLSGNKLIAFIWHWKIIRNEIGLNYPIAIYYQILYTFFSIFDRIQLGKRLFKGFI